MNNIIQENSPDLDLPALNSAKFSEPQTFQPVGEKFLIFLLGEQYYAVSSKRVSEAIAPLAVTELPNSPEWLLGIANLRGEIISVVDLPKILRRRDLASAPKSKFVVLNSRVFESGAAFKVDKICEIVIVPNEEIQFGENKKSPHVTGKILRKSQTLHLIDSEKLLSTLTINQNFSAN